MPESKAEKLEAALKRLHSVRKSLLLDRISTGKEKRDAADELLYVIDFLQAATPEFLIGDAISSNPFFMPWPPAPGIW